MKKILTPMVVFLLVFAWYSNQLMTQEKGNQVPINLARNKPASASGSQEGHPPEHGNDQDGDTRWCAPDGNGGYWWQVDLQKPEELTGCQITWEFERPYYYKIEGSADAKAWSLLVDQTQKNEKGSNGKHSFSAKNIRYVKITVTKTGEGSWASFYEVEVFGTGFESPPKLAKNNSPKTKGKNKGKSPPTEEGLLKEVKVPAGFKATIFGMPPEVNYPTCLACAPTGEVFVGVDLNGSLDAKGDRGKVIRCIDTDGDGKMDKSNVFCKIDSPRGLHFDHKTLYVLGPPDLVSFHDDDGDGVADRKETLVKGIGFDLKFRGADHTTNGFRFGIDGWIYIAVGDYGFMKAEGKDGKTVQFRGGGIVRVRPDGTDLEIVSRGQRNIYDVAVSPTLDLFTRDNTNDGGGWNVRLSHVVPLAQMGYPTLFKNFPDEIVPALVDYGGGSPCGSLFMDEPGFAPEYGTALYTCDWGRSIVYRHPLKANGASYTPEQIPFVAIPKPTDMDVDAQGKIYIASWRNGGFNFSDPNVGFVAQVTDSKNSQPPLPDLAKAKTEELLSILQSASHVRRFAAQREILRRGNSPELVKGLEKIMAEKGTLPVRVAAIFTYKQLLGVQAIEGLLKLVNEEAIQEGVLRALADRTKEAEKVSSKVFVEALRAKNPRVRLQGAIALGRLHRLDAANDLINALTDDDPLVAHITRQALIEMKAVEACTKRLTDPRFAPHCLKVLQWIHEPAVTQAVIERFQQLEKSSPHRLAFISALCRLYSKEAPWDGKWWGTRPDTTGPFFKPVAWSETDKVKEVLKRVLADEEAQLPEVLTELKKHRIELGDTQSKILGLGKQTKFQGLALDLIFSEKTPTKEMLQLCEDLAGNAKLATEVRYKALRNLQNFSNVPGGLASASRAFSQLSAEEKVKEFKVVWQEFTRDPKHEKQISFFMNLADSPEVREKELAFTILLLQAKNQLTKGDAKIQAGKKIEQSWEKQENTLPLLRAITATQAEGFGPKIRDLVKDSRPEVQQLAQAAVKTLGLEKDDSKEKRVIIKGQKYDDVVAQAMKEKGDPKEGELVFLKANCNACHTISPREVLKGPYLGDVAVRYKRPELLESILKPSEKIAQGFETQFFVTNAGRLIEGFVTKESGDEIELRNGQGVSIVLAKKEIEERGRRKTSMMPNDISENLTLRELTSLLAYLELMTNVKTPVKKGK